MKVNSTVIETLRHTGVVTPVETAPPTTTAPVDASGDAEPCCPPLLGALLAAEEAEQLSVVLKALADPIRIRLVNLIARSGEVCACDLPEALDRSQPTISHHLSTLVKAGLLHREQRGKWAWFRLDDRRLAEVRNALGPTPAAS